MPELTYAERSAAAADIDEILRLHHEWWQANVNCDIPRMVKVFPSPGEEYLMFNVNGHPYFGMTEKVRVWEYYRDYIAEQAGLDIRVMRLEIRGDTAWLACEGFFEPRAIDGEWIGDGVDGSHYRATEIYHRDDGDGGAAWRMWHFHGSPMAPVDEPRPAFDDTTEKRGLGWVPWTPLPAREA